MFGKATYILFELGWAVPVLLLQWAVGWRTLRSQLRVLVPAVVLPTAYLSAADGVAIAQHIWTLHDGRIMGLRIGDVPIEEVIFFLLTNAMIVQSVLLVALPGSQLPRITFLHRYSSTMRLFDKSGRRW